MNLGGTEYKAYDLIRWNGSSFSLYFDGSANSIPEGADMDGAYVTSGGDILFSLDIPTEVDGLDVMHNDIIEWDQLSYAIYFDADASGMPTSANVGAPKGSESGDGDCDNTPDVDDNCSISFNPWQEDTYPAGGNLCGDACECEGNFDNDVDVDGTDTTKFLEDLGRFFYNDPCPKNCQTGDWCEYPTRFTDNGDGTVTDNDTGLMWIKDACEAGCCYTWQASFDYIDQMNAGTHENFGYSNWRVPSKSELESLLDPPHSEPCLPSGHPFENSRSSPWWLYWCWSSTEVDPTQAWLVDFDDCGSPQRSKTASYYVWPVRDP